MPLFGRARKSKPVPPPSADLPPGEQVERGVAASLLQGRAVIAGALYMTDRRLMFEAKKGEARWLTVRYDEVKSAGLYPYARARMGAPGSMNQCLFIETTKGEHVWWDFDNRDEAEWLPLVQQHAETARSGAADDE
jgi:hypothetical protein